MPAVAVMTAAASSSATRKSNLAPEKRYKCQFCSRAFSRSEHRSRHERSRKCHPPPLPETGGGWAVYREGTTIFAATCGDRVRLANIATSIIDTKERPFKCMKCRSTFVRRDLLLRHDRTVHRKDGGVPLHSEVKRRAGAKNPPVAGPSKPSITID